MRDPRAKRLVTQMPDPRKGGPIRHMRCSWLRGHLTLRIAPRDARGAVIVAPSQFLGGEEHFCRPDRDAQSAITLAPLGAGGGGDRPWVQGRRAVISAPSHRRPGDDHLCNPSLGGRGPKAQQSANRDYLGARGDGSCKPRPRPTVDPWSARGYLCAFAPPPCRLGQTSSATNSMITGVDPVPSTSLAQLARVHARDSGSPWG